MHEEPARDGGLSIDVLITAEAVVACLAGLIYALAWARRILGVGVETLAGDLRRSTPGESHLPRIPRPLRLIGLGYALPMLLAFLALLVIDPDDAVFATLVTVPGQLFCALIGGALGLLLVLPVLGLTRLVRSGQVRHHPLMVAVLVLLLLIVPWAVLGTWAAESPYEGRRSPDWLLLLGIQRDGVEVEHTAALRLTQVMTYVIAGLLAFAGWSSRRGRTDDEQEHADLRGPDAP